jgi:hypothetical protein
MCKHVLPCGIYNSNSLQHYQMKLILITFDISLAYAMNLSIAGLFRVG